MDKSKIRQFMKDWRGRGEEIRDTENYWIELLSALGFSEPTKVIKREKSVYVDGTPKSIDVYLDGKRVLIEQKSYGINLDKKEQQSDGIWLTPYQQGKRYSDNLPVAERVDKIITCNFDEFRIHDLGQKRPELNPTVIKLSELDKKAHIFDFMFKDASAKLHAVEEDVSVKAGKFIKELYGMFLEQYGNDAPETLKNLNILCVRLVFLFYCEDAGIFGRDQFLHFLKASDEMHIGPDLAMLFDVLNTKEEDRKNFLPDTYKAFPYVNGGLFAKEIEMPYITGEILEKIISLSDNFDWSGIDPTVFGACFESTLNPDTRRKGGMHYTSVENIHKVIEPLFLTDLRDELDEILGDKSPKTKRIKLDNFQNKLANLKFLDPACGSGNFLTETYLCLRKMENEIIEAKIELDPNQVSGQIVAGTAINPIKVSIQQFYGIEINDFAVSVAMTALWIAEAQMIQKTMEIVHQPIDFLPLEMLPHIKEGNALRMDWEDVVPKYELNYIMGNPPFVGYKEKSAQQKEDLNNVCRFNGVVIPNTGSLDYVAGWYYQAITFIIGTNIKCALVSTNSITQGEQVAILWQRLFEQGLNILFAYKTFIWDNEVSDKAHVHCVIIGFDVSDKRGSKYLYNENGTLTIVEQINPYLQNAPLVWIKSRRKPLCKSKEITLGVHIFDNHNFIFSDDEYDEFLKKEPEAQPYFKHWVSAEDFLHNKYRWYLDLSNCPTTHLSKMPLSLDRVKKVIDYRKNNNSARGTNLADNPFKPKQGWKANSNYLLIPNTTSESRKYIPMAFCTPETVVTMPDLAIPNADLYDFGVLTSNIHMAWMRTVAGRLEMRYRYANGIVYNNYPWPNPTDEQKAKIVQTAQSILDARALYPDASLADMYNPDNDFLYPELRKAHLANDIAVMEAYGIKKGDPEFHDESACVAMLMIMYQELLNDEK